ncbi:hypothetical protein EV209_0787 [Cuneatibacter caecimuris]|uniref:Uncharacterized protein n=1 Tax=Cuneatibacter caecimuris TaxID=1796618 RepID=A0A4Q7PQ72_9FIRM|nr:hypothetical protein EV209_0787 [Cuneatibacter caecimuris]
MLEFRNFIIREDNCIALTMKSIACLRTENLLV